MIVCIIAHCSVSTASSYIFKNNDLPSRFDVLKVCCEDQNVPDLSMNHIPRPKLCTENENVNSSSMNSKEKVSQFWELHYFSYNFFISLFWFDTIIPTILFLYYQNFGVFIESIWIIQWQKNSSIMKNTYICVRRIYIFSVRPRCHIVMYHDSRDLNTFPQI